jgi:tetratricopeptide (TPR) repeat protein
MRQSLRQCLVATGSVLAIACTRKPPPGTGASPLALDVSGCASMTSDDVCVVRDETMRVLVGSTAEARFDGGAAGAPVEARALATFDDARLYELRVPRGVRRVRVTTPASAAMASQDGAFATRADDPPAWLTDAHARADRGEKDAALDVYLAQARAGEGAEAAMALGQAARIELARSHVDASVTLLRDAIAKDRAAGRRSDAVDDSMALAFALEQRSHRYAEARAAIEATRDLLEHYPDGRAREPYYSGVLASELGDRREALRQFREAERRATRLGLARLARQVRSAVAVELDFLGRFEDALAIRRAQENELAGDACGLLAVRSGMGFGLLMIATRSGVDAARVREASAILEKARAETGCADAYLHAVTLGNLALGALASGRVDEAAASLAAARARVPEPPLSEAFFWLDLDARIALSRQRPARALEVYDELETRARAAIQPAEEWSALSGRGNALEALGRTRDALRAYAQAEDVLDDAGLAIPVGEGRARFLVERERNASAAIALLVASGKADQAYAWARRARRRILTGLEATRRVEGANDADRARWEAAIARYVGERAAIDEEVALDWKLPVADLARVQERRRARELTLRSAIETVFSALPGGARASRGDLPPPSAGELTLLLHPAADGWTAMAADTSGVFVFHVPPFPAGASGEEMSRSLLAPLRTRIERASRLRLLLPGALAAFDVHDLPYDGAPLLARLPVVYGLDLAAAPAAARSLRALVVGDPQRNLPEARREARAVADALAATSAADVALLEAGTATHAAVIDALGTASLFHYAGHATYGGEDGWDSALPLAAGGHLLVADVLALPHVPARVVLSGCNVAHTSSASPGETLGIAQAFLVAGSDSVIAPTRSVSDALSFRFAEALYAELSSDADVPRAARRALLRLRAQEPAGDWANFRVLRR